MKINIFIERLVLDGLSVPYHHRPLLKTAIETELAHLLTVYGGSPANGLFTGKSVAHIFAGDIHPVDKSNPRRLGQQIARAVHGGIIQ
jgi:hypothetical protein